MVTGVMRRVLVVEDEPLVATLLSDSLTRRGFDVRVAHSASAGVKSAENFDPDIAVLDINLGHGATGVDLAFILQQKFPGVAVVFLTQHPNLKTAGYSARDMPANCTFVRKDLVTDGDAVFDAIDAAVSDRKKVGTAELPSTALDRLTPTQLDVLRMIAQGFTNSEIARRRKTSLRAVEHLLAAIYAELAVDRHSDLNPRVEAVRIFIDLAGSPART